MNLLDKLKLLLKLRKLSKEYPNMEALITAIKTKSGYTAIALALSTLLPVVGISGDTQKDVQTILGSLLAIFIRAGIVKAEVK